MGKTKQKRSKKKRNNEKQHENNMAAIDRLSALPDDVICHILSFLPTVMSVATSILAKRWRFLWAHVPSLDFDFSYNKHKYPGRRSSTSSLRIIDRVMIMHKVQSLNTFRLSDYATNKCSSFELETWITAVIERKVRNLDLTYDLVLPKCLFTCKTIVSLSLKNCIGMPSSSGDVSLPSLKTLRLYFVSFDEDRQNELTHFLSGCPVLEELTINLRRYVPVISISSPTLKRLVLNSKMHFVRSYSILEVLKINIDTPALRYLWVQVMPTEQVSIVGEITSLIEADIIFPDYKLLNPDFLYPHSVLELVGSSSISNVKRLNLSTDELKVRDSRISALTINFHNLTTLELDTDWRFLSYFLATADNLQVLIIHKVKHWREPRQVPTCVSSHLRSVTIDEFTCTDHEFELITYLLWNAKVLERMEIYSECLDEIGLKKKIEALERGSKACELIIY